MATQLDHVGLDILQYSNKLKSTIIPLYKPVLQAYKSVQFKILQHAPESGSLYFPQRQRGKFDRDAGSEVYAPLELLISLKIYSGSLVTLTQKNTEKSLVCHIIACKSLEDEEMIFLTQLSQHNCKFDLSEPIEIKTDFTNIQKANKLTIARVLTTNYNSNPDHETIALERYFKSKRTLKSGDLFELSIKLQKNAQTPHTETLQNIDSKLLEDFQPPQIPTISSNDESIHFNQLYKVIKTEANGEETFSAVFIDAADQQTTISQVRAVNEELPRNEDVLAKDMCPALFTDILSCFEETQGVLLDTADSEIIEACVHGVATWYGIPVVTLGFGSFIGLPEDRVAQEIGDFFALVKSYSFCMVHLKDIEETTPKPQGSQKPDAPDRIFITLRTYINELNNGIRIIASVNDAEQLFPPIRALFRKQVKSASLDINARISFIKCVTFSKPYYGYDLPRYNLALNEKQLKELATVFNGLSFTEMRFAFEMAATLDVSGLSDVVNDIKALSMTVVAPKIPKVYWDDVGGLGDVKEEIIEMIQFPLENPELYAGENGLIQRSGILFFGPPGSGKTLLAKAVATECKLNFLSVKGPELLDMYIGESERKVRQVFQTARENNPCILFFDELDSLAPQRGRGSDSGGVMDRVVSQLLTEMSSAPNGVFIIGATNRPDLLDQSLLRPGRFERLLYLGISTSHEDKMKVFKAVTKKYVHKDDVDFPKLLKFLDEQNKERLTGADLTALCNDAMSSALREKVQAIKQEHIIKVKTDPKLTIRKLLESMTDAELSIEVSMSDYMNAAKSIIPSVSESELQHYETLRKEFARA